MQQSPSASSMLLSGPRVYAQMANDGALPTFMGQLHGDHPRIAVLAQTLLCVMVVWSAGLRELLEFAGVMLSLSAGAVVIGWLKQEFNNPAPSLRYFQLIAALTFLAATIGIAVAALTMRPGSALAAVVLIGFGLLVHYWPSRSVTKK